MATINKEITINAPLEKIFTYVSRPSNLPEIWPSLMQIKNEILLPNGGYGFQWEYEMAGAYLKGTGEYTDIAPNLWFTAKIEGEIECTITWTFRSKESQTRVTFAIEYKKPLPILHQLSKKIVQEMNEREADFIMANLQAKFVLIDVDS